MRLIFFFLPDPHEHADTTHAIPNNYRKSETPPEEFLGHFHSPHVSIFDGFVIRSSGMTVVQNGGVGAAVVKQPNKSHKIKNKLDGNEAVMGQCKRLSSEREKYRTCYKNTHRQIYEERTPPTFPVPSYRDYPSPFLQI